MATAAVLPVFGRPQDWMPADFAFPREAAAVLASGRVLDCGTGPGHYMRAALRSSRVREYVGVEIDSTVVTRTSAAVDWRARVPWRIVTADVFAYLSGKESRGPWDTICWDVMPVYNLDGTIAHYKDLRSWTWMLEMLRQRLAPGGQIVSFHEGERFKENATWTAIVQDANDRPHTLMIYGCHHER